jgi:hypothetical protein
MEDQLALLELWVLARYVADSQVQKTVTVKKMWNYFNMSRPY